MLVYLHVLERCGGIGRGKVGEYFEQCAMSRILSVGPSYHMLANRVTDL